MWLKHIVGLELRKLLAYMCLLLQKNDYSVSRGSIRSNLLSRKGKVMSAYILPSSDSIRGTTLDMLSLIYQLVTHKFLMVGIIYMILGKYYLSYQWSGWKARETFVEILTETKSFMWSCFVGLPELSAELLNACASGR